MLYVSTIKLILFVRGEMVKLNQNLKRSPRSCKAATKYSEKVLRDGKKLAFCYSGSAICTPCHHMATCLA